MKKDNIIYNVYYYILEPSYYEHSKKKYVERSFTSKKETLVFVEEAKKVYPEQIFMNKIKVLRLTAIDKYNKNY